MIRYFVITLCLWVWSSVAFSCEICGCSAVGQTYGLLPNSSRHFVGVRWHSRAFITEHIPLASHTGEMSRSIEHFNSMELWSRIKLSDRWQAFITLPYHYFRMEESGDTQKKQGIGDAVINIGYEVVNTHKRPFGGWRHYLLLTAGVKLPTGRFDAEINWHDTNPNFQMGSGSWDYLANINYSLQYYDWGLQTDLYYRFNSTNTYGYQFGQSGGLQSRFFYKKSIKENMLLIPHLGVRHDRSAQDYNVNHYNDLSGGYFTTAQLAADFYLRRFFMGYSAQVPMAQYWAGGMVKMRYYHMINFTYLL